MFDKYFDTFLFTEETIKNPQILNTNELLSQFSYIDFDNIYIDVNTILNTDLLITWEEFYDNIQSSIMFDFFRFIDQFNIQFIYNGYILKSVLFYIFKNFSKKGIPFKTMRKLREWKSNQLDLNLDFSNEFVKHHFNTIDIDDLTNIYQDLKSVYSNYSYDYSIDVFFRYFHHYFQTVLSNRDFLYITRPNDFVIRYNLTKKINRTVNINVSILSTITTMLTTEYLNYAFNEKIKDKKDTVYLRRIDSILRRLELENDSFYKWTKFSKEEKLELAIKAYDQKRRDNEIAKIKRQEKFTSNNTNKYPKASYELEYEYDYVELDYAQFKPDYSFNRQSSEFFPSLLDSIETTNKEHKEFRFDSDEYEQFLRGKI